MTRLGAFVRDDRGTATIEFVFIIPTVLLILLASIESSFFMIRHVMLERSVDLVVRDIRLGNLNGISHNDLKTEICQHGVLGESVIECVNSMRIWMQPVNTANFSMIAPPLYCVDRDADVLALPPTPPATEFLLGTDNDIMLMRICLKERPMFPTTIVGARLINDAKEDGDPDGDGHYAIMTTTVFVNEPG